MMDSGFIRPSSSPASSPIFFVPKREGGLQACIDYRAINRITRNNRYPLPLIPVLLDQLKNANVFTKLYLRGAYHLVRVRQGEEWKTAFCTKCGLYGYRVMPFVLCNAPAAFQFFMDKVLRGLLDVSCIVYIDDILVYSSNMEDHVIHVAAVFERLQQNFLYAKLETCSFHTSDVEFLGFIIGPGGIHMDDKKIQAILQWESPRNVKALQSFIGFANFYRRFTKDFSNTIQPLTHLLHKGVSFLWTEAAELAFRTLKTCFTTAPVLTHPDTMQPFILETDASYYVIGGVLSQRHPNMGQVHPVAFYSKKLSPCEINYSITDKELLAIKRGCEEWRHYLMGARHTVEIYTDHRNLLFLKTARALSPRQLRWTLFFSEYDFVIKYRPGPQNGKADALSRPSLPQDSPSVLEEDHPAILKTSAFPQELHVSATSGEFVDEVRKQHDGIEIQK